MHFAAEKKKKKEKAFCTRVPPKSGINGTKRTGGEKKKNKGRMAVECHLRRKRRKEEPKKKEKVP